MTAIRFAGLSLVAMTGIAGLVADTNPEGLAWPAINMHAAFGAALLSMILVNFRAQRAADMTIERARARCRVLSRQVYLLLYGMVAVGLLMHMASQRMLSQPPAILRDYFIYGICALLAIRILTELSVRRPPAPQMSPGLARAEDVAAPR